MDRFLILPEALLAVDREAGARGGEILGFYHSHPDAAAQPSGFDLEQAWPTYSYVVMQVNRATAGELSSWVLAVDRSHFEREEIVAAEA